MVKVLFVFTAFSQYESSPVSVSSQVVDFPDKAEAEANIRRTSQALQDSRQLSLNVVRFYDPHAK